jgi:drug/metabolite transporter (DMT)-like permease
MTDRTSAAARIVVPFILISLIWGSTWIVILGQLGTVPPSWSVTYRFLIAALFMLGYALLTRTSLRIGAGGHAMALIFGVLQFSLNFNFVYRAELYITSGIVAVSFALLLVFNAILSRIFLKVPVSLRFIIGSVIAMSGIGLLFRNEVHAMPSASGDVLIGFGLIFLAVLSASIANVMQATARARALPIASLLVWGMGYGAIGNAIWAWATTGPPVIEPTFNYIAGALYLGGIASALAFLLYFGLIREMGAARAAYTGVVTPIIAMLFSTIFEDYHWTGYAIAGGVLALAGLVVALSERRPPPRPQPFGRDG